MKRKGQNVKVIILIIVVIIAVLLGLSVKSFDDDKDLNFVEKAIKDSINYVEKIVYAPIDFIGDKISYIKESKDLYKKYTNLKEKVEKTETYYAQIEELQKELTELKNTLKLNSTLSEYTYLFTKFSYFSDEFFKLSALAARSSLSLTLINW